MPMTPRLRKELLELVRGEYYFLTSPPEFHWRDRNGDYIRMRKMDERYLQNCINFVCRKLDDLPAATSRAATFQVYRRGAKLLTQLSEELSRKRRRSGAH